MYWIVIIAYLLGESTALLRTNTDLIFCFARKKIVKTFITLTLIQILQVDLKVQALDLQALYSN